MENHPDHKIRVVTLGLNGCVASSVSGPADLFAAANIARGAASLELQVSLPIFEWHLAADQRVSSQSGVIFEPSIAFDQANDCDLLIVPGFGSYSPESRNRVLASSVDLVTFLKSLEPENTRILGLCTGTLLLAKAGLLNGRAATTSWWNAAEFSRTYPSVDLVQSQMVVQDGNIITAGAGAAYFDAVLHLLALECGPWLSETVARYFVLDQRRTSQSDYILPSFLALSDDVVSSADKWLRERMADNEPVPRLANHLGMSQRSLHRHFVKTVGMSPQRYALALRMTFARKLLQDGGASVDQIAGKVGYTDPNAFRRAFKMFFGKNTSAYKSADVRVLSGNVPN